MEMGPTEARILKECYAWKRKIPDKILNAPELLLGLEFYYIAFMALNTTRHLGFSPGPISYFAIEDYAARQKLDENEIEILHHHMQCMDQAFLKYHNKKHEN
ncbi:MAG: hypothetical protein KAS32_07010 [Candidatus Peribacteraceae bacterium]|nr:hypothetical protein [Candidatus Peribacteraceae bacterium]